ncbi:MAG TPA: NUDIX domain-containing protein [Planctomycetes bacterium]|nr:NUDIX domain-containing protein [Planctomycetota bacterium]
MRTLSADDPTLRDPGERADLEALLSSYRPADERDGRERERMLAFLERHPDALERTCAEGHFTGSALVLDAERRRVLLTHHRKLGRWLQLGGHADGDGNLPRVALRESIEESGIATLTIDPNPIDLDIHRIPARPGEPAHLHLDLRFLVHAPANAREAISEESLELAWFDPAEAAALDLDESVHRLLRFAFAAPGT